MLLSDFLKPFKQFALVAGHFAERHFAERTLCRRTICRKNFLPNGHFDGLYAEKTFCQKDNLPKIEKFSGFAWKGSLTRSTFV